MIPVNDYNGYETCIIFAYVRLSGKVSYNKLKLKAGKFNVKDIKNFY